MATTKSMSILRRRRSPRLAEKRRAVRELKRVRFMATFMPRRSQRLASVKQRELGLIAKPQTCTYLRRSERLTVKLEVADKSATESPQTHLERHECQQHEKQFTRFKTHAAGADSVIANVNAMNSLIVQTPPKSQADSHALTASPTMIKSDVYHQKHPVQLAVRVIFCPIRMACEM